LAIHKIPRSQLQREEPQMGAVDDDFKLMRRTVMGVSALVMLSTGFDWVRYAQSERTVSVRHNEAIVPGRLYVDIYAITGANLVMA